LLLGDEFLELFVVLREVDLGGNDRVQPALDDVPNACAMR
jgi:hypothetical protein